MYFRFRDSLFRPKEISKYSQNTLKSILYLLVLIIIVSLPNIIYTIISGGVNDSEIIECLNEIKYEQIEFKLENNKLSPTGTKLDSLYYTELLSIGFSDYKMEELNNNTNVNSYFTSIYVKDNLSNLNLVFTEDGIMIFSLRYNYIQLLTQLSYTELGVEDIDFNSIRQNSEAEKFLKVLQNIKEYYKTTIVITDSLSTIINEVLDAIFIIAIPVLFSLLIYRGSGIKFKYMLNTAISCYTIVAVVDFIFLGNASMIIRLIAQFIMISFYIRSIYSQIGINKGE